MKNIVLFTFCISSFISFTQRDYFGGEIYSKEQYQYGKIDVKFKAAKGSGILSTFFTYKNGSEIAGTPWEEIDIEVFGKGNAQSWQSNIITGIAGEQREMSEGVHNYDFSFADDYHLFSLEWTPNYVAWYVDGKLERKKEEDSSQVKKLINPQSLRMNLWAAKWTEWVGTFDTSALPQYQLIDYIQYSAYTPGAGKDGSDFTKKWKDNFMFLDENRWQKASWTFDGNLVQFNPKNAFVSAGHLVLAITKKGEEIDVTKIFTNE